MTVGVEKPIEDTMEVEVLSRKMIKPSTPTPDHLRNMKMTFIDDLSPLMYIPLLFCYPNVDTDSKEISSKRDRLKTSLSEILVHYYPFAGRINKEGKSFDCNDEGVEYCETKVCGRLDELIHNGREKIELLDRLAPHISVINFEETPLVAIQVNIFECGGVCIAVSVCHKVADAITGIGFINQWAIASREGVSQLDEPNCYLASHIPSRSLPDGDAGMTFTWTKNSPIKYVTKRFLFDETALTNLKEKSMSLSRAVLVSAVIWKALIGLKEGSIKTSLLVLAMNLRGKAIPPMPLNACGNFYVMTNTWLELDKGGMEFRDIAELISDSMKTNAGSFVKEVSSDEFFDQVCNSFKVFRREMGKKDVSISTIISWCRMPLNDVDFGWGKPSWVGRVHSCWEMITMKDSIECQGGIDVWVTLNEQDMLRFEQDPDIINFAKFTTSGGN